VFKDKLEENNTTMNSLFPMDKSDHTGSSDGSLPPSSLHTVVPTLGDPSMTSFNYGMMYPSMFNWPPYHQYANNNSNTPMCYQPNTTTNTTTTTTDPLHYDQTIRENTDHINRTSNYFQQHCQISPKPENTVENKKRDEYIMCESSPISLQKEDIPAPPPPPSSINVNHQPSILKNNNNTKNSTHQHQHQHQHQHHHHHIHRSPSLETATTFDEGSHHSNNSKDNCSMNSKLSQQSTKTRMITMECPTSNNSNNNNSNKSHPRTTIITPKKLLFDEMPNFVVKTESMHQQGMMFIYIFFLYFVKKKNIF